MSQRRLGLDLEIPDEFGYWLAGLATGDACFTASISNDCRNEYPHIGVRFQIGLRKDDSPILEEIQKMLKVGSVYEHKGKTNPMMYWTVSAKGDLYHVIVPLFEKYPLRGRKAHDFAIWKKMVDLRYHESSCRSLGYGRGSMPRPEGYWTKMKSLVQELQASRRYEGGRYDCVSTG